MRSKSWKTEYWPALIQKITDEGGEDYPYIYCDTIRYNNFFNKRLNIELPDNDGRSNRNNTMKRIHTPEMMQCVLDNWEEFLSLTHYPQYLFNSMKSKEKQWLLNIIYKQRKEEFDALVSENNN